MDSNKELTQLAAHLSDHGLRVSGEGPDQLRVTNPISGAANERVTLTEGRYLTDEGYELGQRGDEEASAGRLAYLLGVPTSPPADIRTVPSWLPAGRTVEALRAGIRWDAIRAKLPLGDRVLERLGTRTGAVIEDPWGGALYWLVPVGTAATWNAPGSRALGVACWVTVPGPLAEGAGPHWRVPIATNGVLTRPEELREVLEAAVTGQEAAR